MKISARGLFLLTVLLLAMAVSIGCGPLCSGSDDDDDDTSDDDGTDDDDASGDECVDFYAECLNITPAAAEEYCSVLDQYEDLGECYEEAINDYLECVFENFDCATGDPTSIQECVDQFTADILDCAGADDDTSDDDTSDDDTTDDDTVDDDTDDDDDDDDDDNDDDDDYSCAGIADGMINTCQLTLTDMDGNQVDESGLVEWCEYSESLFADAKTDSPFWNCMGDCVFEEFCDEGCFDDCLDPPSPGSGCGDTVDAVYACNIVWVFDNNLYWIPEMDMQAVCSSLTDWPWECYADCIPGGCDDMLDCLNDC